MKFCVFLSLKTSYIRGEGINKMEIDKRIVIGLLLLVLLGGVAVAIYILAGGSFGGQADLGTILQAEIV
jgi:hypothetical protein